MKFRSLALTAVAAGALGLAGCGSGNDTASSAGGGNADAATLLTAAFKPTGESKIKSGTIELKIGGSLSGEQSGSGEATAVIKLNEGKDGQLPEFSADVSIKGEADGAGKIDVKNAGAVYTDDRFYINYDGESYDVGEELSKRAMTSLQQAMKQSAAQAGTTADQKQVIAKLGLHPETWLTDPKVEGTEDIGGTESYKITGSVNVQALVPDVLAAATKAQGLTGGAVGKKVPEVTDEQLDEAAKQIEKLDVTIWIGKDDNILRKVQVDAVINGKKKGDKLDGSLSLTLTKVNEEQDIKAPSDTKPITDLMPKLGGLFGAVSGAAGGSQMGAFGGGAASPSSAVSEAYVQCVNAAGGDAAKLNACQAQLQK